MNTTINFTYQFLVRKFKVFSEFLFDDHIKSKLLKLGRSFREEKAATNSRFPYDHADRLLKDIKKLGVSDDGSTFMDHFRRQITEIGNALGYVRMVRSGGLHFVSQGIKFIPDLNEKVDFEAEVRDEGLPSESVAAAANVNRVLAALTKQFTADTSYFALLVSIFAPVLNTAEQRHLANFYLIIPSLMLNYVERLKDMKEKINKQSGRQEITFTDDGFVLGVAYILRVLHLDVAFDSLHWFDSMEQSIRAKQAEYAKEMDKLRSSHGGGGAAAAAAGKAKGGKAAVVKGGKKGGGAATAVNGEEEDEEFAQLAVQQKKWAAIQKEFELLFYTFSGARIFFQSEEEGGMGGGKGEGEKGGEGKGERKEAEAQSSAPHPPAEGGAGSDGGGDVPSAPPMAPPMAPPTAPPL